MHYRWTVENLTHLFIVFRSRSHTDIVNYEAVQIASVVIFLARSILHSIVPDVAGIVTLGSRSEAEGITAGLISQVKSESALLPSRYIGREGTAALPVLRLLGFAVDQRWDLVPDVLGGLDALGRLDGLDAATLLLERGTSRSGGHVGGR
jgi:hypothetical protein